jgi:hypothetical protein
VAAKNKKIMGLQVPFTYRNKDSVCTIYIDNSSIPAYVFVDLHDQDLIAEFGKEIVIKTNFENRLSKKDDYPALVTLRDAIFDAIKGVPEFAVKNNSEISRKLS